jgi:hypothetical protein
MSTSSSLNLDMKRAVSFTVWPVYWRQQTNRTHPLLLHEVTTIRPFSSVNLCSNMWFGIRARTRNLGYDPSHHLQRSNVQRITSSITHPPNAYSKVPGSEIRSGIEYPFFHLSFFSDHFFYYLPQCCNLSEDIQRQYWQSLLMVCSRYIQWYISYWQALLMAYIRYIQWYISCWQSLLVACSR